MDPIKTIDLENEMNFLEAIDYLLTGKCIGIRPKGNQSYLVKYKPHYANKEDPSYMLCWHRSVKGNGQGNESFRTDQITDYWTAVVIDCREIPDIINNSFILENISNFDIK